jgi:hypothetical protein
MLQLWHKKSHAVAIRVLLRLVPTPNSTIQPSHVLCWSGTTGNQSTWRGWIMLLHNNYFLKKY